MSYKVKDVDGRRELLTWRKKVVKRQTKAWVKLEDAWPVGSGLDIMFFNFLIKSTYKVLEHYGIFFY